MPTLDVEPKTVERLRIEGPSWRLLFAGLRHPTRFFRELLARIQEDRTLTYAAALAYYFFLALFPFLLFLLALVTVLPLHGLDTWILGEMKQVVPGEGYALLERAIRGLLAQPRGGLVSLGAVLALWTASSAFASVMDALSRAYRVADCRPWWKARAIAIALTVGVSLFMIGAFTLALFGGPVVRVVGNAFGPGAALVSFVVRWLLAIAFISIVVAAVYYFCPDVDQQSWRWVTPGSVVFTLGFGATSAAFSYYVSHFGSYNKTYGSLGAVIILLVWFYLFAIFLLLGGQLNALLEHRSPIGKDVGEKQAPRAAEQARRVERDERARA
ncbi:MAG TPA: YihY/virulence factor BrkB family protein [Candidatus Binatia bacterium]|nr:YihY/virulence factor BrkB family protein [Candidatus Binatia bacterium]